MCIFYIKRHFFMEVLMIKSIMSQLLQIETCNCIHMNKILTFSKYVKITFIMAKNCYFVVSG